MAGTGLTGFLQNLTGTEMIAIAIVALVVLGPDRLPEMARGAGRMMHKLRTMTEGMQSEVRDVMADPSMQPLKELGELAARPRQKLTEYALEAEAEERAKREAAEAERQRAEAADADADADEPADTDEAAGAEQHDAAGEATPPPDTAAPDTQPSDTAALDTQPSDSAALDATADDAAAGATSAGDTPTDDGVAGDEPVSREPG
ncbi:MAG: twin-arginine translocase TatA/TatE family subunit [Microthrixaceae bacterium]